MSNGNVHSLLAAVIITYNRAEFLAERSLPSVAAQTRLPDLVVVVDDSDKEHLLQNQKTISAFSQQSGISVIHLGPQRMLRNANNALAPSGGFGFLGKHCAARNAAVLAVLMEGFSPEKDWVAFLEDDDEWLPHHLAQAEAMINAAGEKPLDFLPAAYEYRLPSGTEETRLPAEFDGRAFLVGNPGVEGSTFILRLSALLRAGMFDESLPGCDDRDLAVNLSLLNNLHYKQPFMLSVIKHDEENHAQLTTGGAQLAGLARFINKWRGWMSGPEYIAFCERANKLFGWRSSMARPRRSMSTAAAMPIAVHTEDRIALVIGIIVDSEVKDNPLLDDILELMKDKRLLSTDIVLMPRAGVRSRVLQNTVHQLRQAGARVYCLDKPYIEEIMNDLAIPADLRRARPIAINRTILQRAAYKVSYDYYKPVFWILDGDTRLHGLAMSNGKVAKTKPDYVGEMIRLRASGCDVAVGSIHGAAPLPRALTVRTQMVDLLHFFACLQRPAKKRFFPTLTIADAARAKIAGDYYHDCGDHPHLEQPVGLPPLPTTCTQQRFVHELPRLIHRVLAGDAVTRPLLGGITPSRPPHRGGNTLIFNADALCSVPNGFVRGAFEGMRRQDEIWRIIGEAVHGWKVAAGDFPITQTRENEPPQAPDMQRLQADIVGHAVSTALRHAVAGKRFKGVDEFTKFVLRRETQFFYKVEELARVRIALLRASFYRVVGVAESLRGLIARNCEAKKSVAALHALQKMEKQFLQAAQTLSDYGFSEEQSMDALRAIITDFPALCWDMEKTARKKFRLDAGLKMVVWLQNERQKNAEHLLAKILPAAASPRFLGRGSEGTVYTDKQKIYKVIHRWYCRREIEHPNLFLDALQQLPPTGWSTLYPIIQSIRDESDLVLVMPYEQTALYQGGCGAGMVALLKDLKERGIVVWDVVPKNLRRKGEQVRLIDYGKQLKPFNETDFDLSVRKAWLCWSLGMKKNLRPLLSASLKSAKLPELKGYQNMTYAVEEFAARFRGSDTVLDEVLADSPKRVLDYGCGEGKVALTIAQAGIAVDAYDPNLLAKTNRRLKAARVRVMNLKTLADAKPYDAIILRHVVCEIAADKELIKCLRIIRGLTAAHGKVVITACDMDRVVKEKLYSVNLMPRAADSSRKFLYRKKIRRNGAVRPHVHRPQRELENLFKQAGFKIAARKKFSDMDLDSFTPCGGVLQWVLKPAATTLVSSSTKKSKGKHQ